MRCLADPEPGPVIQPVRLERRIDRLARIEAQAAGASEHFGRIRNRPRNLRIRPEFAMRAEPAAPAGELTDRLLPPRAERPPATRLVSPRGIALRLYLTALFVAQSRPAGTMPANRLPLANADAPVSWIDLIATTSQSRRYGTQRQLKLRQVHDALRRLSGPDVQLVDLPNLDRPATGKYEGFVLRHEAGATAGGGDNGRYLVPSAESKTMYLPGGLFSNGWIHVLEDTELAFLVMLSCLRSRSDKPLVFATSEVRLLQFGLGRDAYESHRLLARLGLVGVHPGPHPGRRLGEGRPLPEVRPAQTAPIRAAERRLRPARHSRHPRESRSAAPAALALCLAVVSWAARVCNATLTIVTSKLRRRGVPGTLQLTRTFGRATPGQVTLVSWDLAIDALARGHGPLDPAVDESGN